MPVARMILAAQQAIPAATQAAGDPRAAVGEIRETLAGIWNNFLEHVPHLLAGLIVVALTAVAASVGRALLHRSLKRSKLRWSLRELLLQMMFVAIWAIGLLITAMIIFPGLTPTKALGGLGLLTVAAGLAFKDIFSNFFAGILLLWRFPFEHGDFITCKAITGRVEEITIRNTVLREVTDELVVVPNSFLFENPVEVLTSRRYRRVTIMTSVAYDVHLPTALEVVKAAVSGCTTVSQEHRIEVFAQQFGSSSMDIQVAWWAGSTPLEQRVSQSEVVTAIKLALDEHKLEIPFPYRTLVFKDPLQVAELRRSLGDRGSSATERADDPTS